jgi:hypothetical protein
MCFGCLPAMRSIVAQVWRRSWNLMGGSTARFGMGLKRRERDKEAKGSAVLPKLWIVVRTFG